MDFIIIGVLCFVNSKIVRKKGRRSGGIIGITLALTFGTIFLASFILIAVSMNNGTIDLNQMAANPQVYLETGEGQNLMLKMNMLSYVALAVSGIISVLIAVKYKPVDPTQTQDQRYTQYWQSGQNVQNENQANTSAWNRSDQNLQNGAPWNGPMTGATYDESELLQNPCSICIIREPDFLNANDVYTVSLNGYQAARLANNTYATIMTNQKMNTVTARDGAGGSLKKPISFLAVEGGYVEIHVKGNSFLPEKTVGKRPASTQPQ